MKKVNLDKYVELFKVKRIKVKNDIKGKKSIIYLPSDFVCYVGDDGAVSFEKFEAHFEVFGEQETFSVLVDDLFWINQKYLLIDNEDEKAFFGTVAKSKKGDKVYSSIHARVAAVYSAVCEGKIKIDPNLDKIED